MARIIIWDEETKVQVSVPPEFARVIAWLAKERVYQIGKFDYGPEDLTHALEGLGEESWFWVKGVLNYTGRVRLHGLGAPLGMQALLKLISTLVSIPEHMLRGHAISSLPTPGLSSGNLE